MIIISGNCSIESEIESFKVAEEIVNNNLTLMRFMVWKPRTKPSAYQGIGVNGFEIAEKINKKFPQIQFVTEILSLDHISKLEETKLPFIYQIGSRNCQNYELLKELGKLENKTIVYKRGFSTTVDEFISGAEYMNPQKNNIWLCLRGIRTFDSSMRFTPDVHSILVIKERFEHNPNKYKIIFDPSHATGHRKFIEKMSLISKAAGVDGLEIEIHSSPDEALSDAIQTLSFDEFRRILGKIL